MSMPAPRSNGVILVLLLAAWSVAPASAQTARALEGMWSDPPATLVGALCSAWCSDAAIEVLYALLDDPANDGLPIGELLTRARDRQNEFLRSMLMPAAAAVFPLDPADDPWLIKCEPYGLVQQVFSRHQLQIRSAGRDRLELRYGEWDARRIVYMNGAVPPRGNAPTRLGASTGRWEGDTLVIATSGATPARALRTQFGPQLRVTERYTRSADGKALDLAATLEDAATLRAPLTLKRIWRWAPESEIAPYQDCEVPASVKSRTLKR